MNVEGIAICCGQIRDTEAILEQVRGLCADGHLNEAWQALIEVSRMITTSAVQIACLALEAAVSEGTD